MADCVSKLTVKSASGQWFDVPCGSCLPCRKRKAAALKRFCEYEQQKFYKQGLSCSFNCLTYSPANVPLSDTGIPTLCKADLKKFFKRFRISLKRSGYTAPYSFLSCGEYGDSDFLPHYHIIGFGLSDVLFDNFACKSWTSDRRSSNWSPIGRIDSRPLLAGGISYVADYIMTAPNGELAKASFDSKGIERPFMTHSKGLGLDYLFDNLDTLVGDNMVSYFNGYPFVIPKYYRDYYNLGSVNPVPILESIQKAAASHHLSVSEFQLQQSYIASKNAVLQARSSGSPIVPDEVRSFSGSNPKLVSSLVCQADDEIVPDWVTSNNFSEV